MKSTSPLCWSRTKNRNGWSALKLETGSARHRGGQRARHRRRGGRLGALLVDLDERLVEDVVDEESLVRIGRIGDAGEVGLLALERERHAEPRRARGAARSSAAGSPRTSAAPRARAPGASFAASSSSFCASSACSHGRQPVDRVGQHDQHRHRVALVGSSSADQPRPARVRIVPVRFMVGTSFCCDGEVENGAGRVRSFSNGVAQSPRK
jgi:hypothetical protein